MTTNVSTIAGTGDAGNTNGVFATFDRPSGIARDSAGNIYVADTFNNSIRKITPAGVVSTFATGFNSPSGITCDSVGNIYVADTNNNKIIKITPAGDKITLAGTGAPGSANGTSATFNSPSGITCDSANNIYVADTYNNSIRKITPAGVVSTLAPWFNRPTGITCDSANNLYVADTNNNKIKKITPEGSVSTLAGTGSQGRADGASATFMFPYGITCDGVGNIYVADTMNNLIRKITPAGIVSTIAGTYGLSGSQDGTSSTFTSPHGILSYGDILYVADTFSNKIRKIKFRVPITIPTYMPDISVYTPNNPSVTLNAGDSISYSYGFDSNKLLPSTVGTYLATITTTIKNSNLDDVTLDYIITSSPDEFNVKIPIIIVPMTDSYTSGYPSMPSVTVTGSLPNTTNYAYKYDGFDDPPTTPGSHTLTVIPTIPNASNYSVTCVETPFTVLPIPLIPLTITAVTPNVLVGSPIDPSATDSGLAIGDIPTYTFTHAKGSILSAGEHIQNVSVIIRRGTQDVTSKYDITVRPATFYVKNALTIKSTMTSYTYGDTAPTGVSVVTPPVEGIQHTYIYGNSPNQPEKVGTYVISETASIPNNLLYDTTFVKGIFRVKPRKLRIILSVTGSMVMYDKTGLLPTDKIDLIEFKYGRYDEFPTIKGNHLLSIKRLVITNTNNDIVTSNYSLQCKNVMVTVN